MTILERQKIKCFDLLTMSQNQDKFREFVDEFHRILIGF